MAIVGAIVVLIVLPCMWITACVLTRLWWDAFHEWRSPPYPAWYPKAVSGPVLTVLGLLTAMAIVLAVTMTAYLAALWFA